MSTTFDTDLELVALYEDFLHHRAGITEWSYDLLSQICDMDGISREDVENFEAEIGKTRCVGCFEKRELVNLDFTECESCAINREMGEAL